jgi:hypothetical protein
MSGMSDLGYHTQLQGGIYGQPDLGGADPVTQAELQEKYTQMAITYAGQPGYVPATYSGPNAPQWASQAGGPGIKPTIGWTCQNSTESPFQPFVEPAGHIPDWTGDTNGIAAGAYDMNQAVAYGDYNPLNVAPLGEGVLQFDDTQTNPNAPTTDVSGQIGRMEY